jgi:hypothetical protein
VTDQSQKTKKTKFNAVPEMGFLSSRNGTSTGNGRPISGTGKLRVWVLHIDNEECGERYKTVAIETGYSENGGNYSAVRTDGLLL